jgi:hypothetical protein
METPKRSSTPAAAAKRLEDRLDEGLEESFPASDPLSVSGDKIVRKTTRTQHEKPKDHEK